ncbi:hypothetical protein PCASD_17874 [Puccinia coronata f. sp. avenae]|uniref:Uncharacterized protein n=1 Tax=Puccinia coronata f. sp. avenae TaxID=200324 RepID=A0A2N5U176_9BASI|nr:hypothetical protein PCASD_17874 [Puccinia coronata f. sp. avenae]
MNQIFSRSSQASTPTLVEASRIARGDSGGGLASVQPLSRPSMDGGGLRWPNRGPWRQGLPPWTYVTSQLQLRAAFRCTEPPAKLVLEL